MSFATDLISIGIQLFPVVIDDADIHVLTPNDSKRHAKIRLTTPNSPPLKAYCHFFFPMHWGIGLYSIDILAHS